MMPTRLFVGGLGNAVDKHMLTSKLSQYGTVVDAEIKEKTDMEGHVTLRFAYVNVDSTEDSLEQCVRALNGKSWQGSNLRVEVARESFLDRLKRERAKAQEQDQGNTTNKFDTSQRDERLFNDRPLGSATRDYKVFPNERKMPRGNVMEPGVLSHVDNWGVPTVQDEKDNRIRSPKRKNKKKNEEEEEMMASFKTFSSVWADTDEEDNGEDGEVRTLSNQEKRRLEEQARSRSFMHDDEGDVSREEEEEEVKDKRQNWGSPTKTMSHIVDFNTSSKKMTRYDPTKQEHAQFQLIPAVAPLPSTDKEESPESPAQDQKAPEFKLLPVKSQRKRKIDEETTDGQKEKGQEEAKKSFSLLDMFNKLNAGQKETENANMEPLGEVPEQLPMIRKQNFFFSEIDPRVQDGIDWMLQHIQEHIARDFKSAESDLYEVIKTRSDRAKKEWAKKSGQQFRGKGRDKKKWSVQRNTAISVMDDQNYDHGWRVAEKIQDENRGKGPRKSIVEGGMGNDTNGFEGNEGHNQDRGRGHLNRGRGRSERGRGTGGRGRSGNNTFSRGQRGSRGGRGRGDVMNSS